MTTTDPVALFATLCAARANHAVRKTIATEGAERTTWDAVRKCADLRFHIAGSDYAWWASCAMLAQAGIAQEQTQDERDVPIRALVRKFPGIGIAAREAILAAVAKK